MNEKHTPGPWAITQDAHPGFDRFVLRSASGNFGHFQGRAWDGVTTEEEDAANARLIAQAPMLYALVRAHALSYPHDEYADRIAQVIEAVEGKGRENDYRD